MALVKCPDCGKMISNHAEYCIECGCPMSFISPNKLNNDALVNDNEYLDLNKNQEQVDSDNSNFEDIQNFIINQDDNSVNGLYIVNKCANSKYHNRTYELCEENADNEFNNYLKEMDEIYSEYQEGNDNMAENDWWYSDNDDN